MEFSDGVIQNMLAFAAGLIGALVGGWFTLYATNKSIRETNDKEERQEEKEIANLLSALGVEVETLWNFHMQRVGHLIEQLPESTPLEFYYPLTQNYFTVYDANAHQLGKIKDRALCEAIVRCYNKCKKVVDGFKYNNELYKDYRDYRDSIGAGKTEEALLKAKFQLLGDYAAAIKADHFELKRLVEEMLRLLK